MNRVNTGITTLAAAWILCACAGYPTGSPTTDVTPAKRYANVLQHADRLRAVGDDGAALRCAG